MLALLEALLLRHQHRVDLVHLGHAPLKRLLVLDQFLYVGVDFASGLLNLLVLLQEVLYEGIETFDDFLDSVFIRATKLLYDGALEVCEEVQESVTRLQANEA